MMNHYYDINLKLKRLELLKHDNFKFYKINIEKIRIKKNIPNLYYR